MNVRENHNHIHIHWLPEAVAAFDKPVSSPQAKAMIQFRDDLAKAKFPHDRIYDLMVEKLRRGDF